MYAGSFFLPFLTQIQMRYYVDPDWLRGYAKQISDTVLTNLLENWAGKKLSGDNRLLYKDILESTKDILEGT